MQAMLLLLHDLQENGQLRMQMGCNVQLYLKHLDRIVSGDLNLRRCSHGHLASQGCKSGHECPETERRDHLLLRDKLKRGFCC